MRRAATMVLDLMDGEDMDGEGNDDVKVYAPHSPRHARA
jgi:hypothetical protein